MTVTLRAANGALYTTTTNAQGYYSFTNLAAGTSTPVIASANRAGRCPGRLSEQQRHEQHVREQQQRTRSRD